MLSIELDECNPARPALKVTIHRGDPVVITVRVDPTREGLTEAQVEATEQLLADLTARTWLAQIRTSAAATTVTATLTKSEALADGILTLAFSLADSTALVADEVYQWDAQVTSGPKAGLTLFGGSIVVEPDVSRAA